MDVPEIEEVLPWMEIAKGELKLNIETDGANDVPIVRKYLASCNLGGGDKWCGAFANWCFIQVGIKGSSKLSLVENWKTWGDDLEKNPALGSVMVIKEDKPKGESHVGFVVGKQSNGKIVLLGGNQSDSVRYSSYSTSNLACYVFPKNYIPNYDLPIVKIINNGLDIENL